MPYPWGVERGILQRARAQAFTKSWVAQGPATPGPPQDRKESSFEWLRSSIDMCARCGMILALVFSQSRAGGAHTWPGRGVWS